MHARENLMAEATALVRRAELKIAPRAEVVAAGFRSNGSLSIFFGEDPVYQFNAAGELRRAFVADTLYKADERTLVGLRRERGESATALVRTELQQSQQADLLRNMQSALGELRTALQTSQYELVACIPPSANLVEELLAWLRDHSQITVAQRPNVS